MIEGYFDESGIHDGAKVCIVGGYYGTQAAWRKFEREWFKILAHYPELQNEGFHARRFFGRDPAGRRIGPFAGWSDEKANKLLERLVQGILRNRVFPIGYGAIVADFLALSLLQRQWLTGAHFRLDGKYVSGGNPTKPYYVPFQFCIL